MRQWSRKVKKHESALMLVPVFYVDRPISDGREGEQVRIAVNGQTAARLPLCSTRSETPMWLRR